MPLFQIPRNLPSDLQSPQNIAPFAYSSSCTSWTSLQIQQSSGRSEGRGTAVVREPLARAQSTKIIGSKNRSLVPAHDQFLFVTEYTLAVIRHTFPTELAPKRTVKEGSPPRARSITCISAFLGKNPGRRENVCLGRSGERSCCSSIS